MQPCKQGGVNQRAYQQGVDAVFAQHVVCAEDADERAQRVERQPEFACVAGVDVPHGPKGEHEQANHAEAVPFFAGDFAV